MHSLGEGGESKVGGFGEVCIVWAKTRYAFFESLSERGESKVGGFGEVCIVWARTGVFWGCLYVARYAFLSDRGESEFECLYGLRHPKSGFPRVAGEGMLGKAGDKKTGGNPVCTHLRKHKSTLGN